MTQEIIPAIMTPGATMQRPPLREGSPEVSFRIVTFYDIQTDSHITRFDYKEHGVQWNFAIRSSDGRSGELEAPKMYSDCTSIRAAKIDLASAFTALAGLLLPEEG